MSYGDSQYGGGAYGADSLTTSTPPGQVIPPPVPGGTTVYYYGTENGIYPLAYGGWAGARPKLASIPGGIVVIPHKENGTTEVIGWWPGADFLHFIRVHDDGSRYPVRGGLGVPVTAMARRNSVTNPSLEVGLNGFVPGVGSPTLARISAPADVATVPDGNFALRATIASAGQLGVTLPTSFVPDGSTVTAGVSAWYSARPTAVRFEVGWTNSVGGALTQSTITFTADQVNETVGQWGRLTATFTPPSGAFTPTFKVVADGLPSAATLYADALLFEAGSTDGSFFDGGTLGATWIGAVDLSASIAAAQVTVIDPDCPLDIPVTYVVSDPSLTGGYAESGPVALESVGRFCWLTHPSYSLPIRCDLRSVPILERDIDQGIFYPIGRSKAVVVTSRRKAPTSEIVFNAVSFAERDSLLDLLDDGSPVLLRAPSRYGYGPGRWWSVGLVTEDREERLAYQDAMTLTAVSTEVEAPSPLFAVPIGT